jgi:hypothetical protein
LGFAALPAIALAGGIAPLVAEETGDPISQLGQRSADDRWKDARKDWLPFGLSRRARRQERKNAAEITQPPEEPAGTAILDAPAHEQPLSLSARKANRSRTGVAAIRASRSHDREEELSHEPPVESTPAAPVSMENLRVHQPTIGPPETAPPPAFETSAAPMVAAEAIPQKVIAPKHRGMAVGAGSTRQLQLAQAGSGAPERMIAPVRVTQLPPLPESEPTVADPPPGPDAQKTILPEPEAKPNDRPLPRSEQIEMPREPLTGAPLKLRKITEIQPYRNYSPEGTADRLCPPGPGSAEASSPPRCPEEQELPLFGSIDRNFIDINYCWEASNLFHRPLYFEDVPLERYGHTYPFAIQPFVSLGKFGTQLVGLPYQMALDPPCSRQYALGYYRPGECAPYLCYQIPLNARAAVMSAGVYTGIAFLFP